MSTLPIYDFNPSSTLNDWYVVNDGVMGGLSQGRLELSEDGHGLFYGRVSLENNGGFTSIRYPFGTKKVTGYTYLVLRVKGDGKRYQIRVKPKTSLYYSYIAYIETSGAWETLRIPMREMYPVFRGNRLKLPNYEAEELQEIGILIGNKEAEEFRLEIDTIYLDTDKD
ncbi:MAG: CIA30 family protein [Eudoraea sp.]|nr:CIA30 family protein [Eudoraea sp.]NNJ39300.1 CIA30 family protein [Eudoraea sp.]